MPCLLEGVSYTPDAFKVRNATFNRPFNGSRIGNDTIYLPNFQTGETIYLPDNCIFEYQYTTGAQQYLSKYGEGTGARFTEVDHWDPSWMSSLYNEGYATFQNTLNFWSNAAESMTRQLRTAGAQVEKKPAIGVVFNTELCLSGPWLIFPAALTILAHIFLILTIVQALLFQGLDDEDLQGLGSLNDVEAMTKAAGDLKVQLAPDNYTERIRFRVQRASRVSEDLDAEPMDTLPASA